MKLFLEQWVMAKKSCAYLMTGEVRHDDNIRKLVTYTLNKEELTSRGFERPSLFWSALEETLPELILLDLMLPEEEGISILKKLKMQNATKDIPVIILSAKDSEFDKVSGLDLGADDYIAKPFSMVELISRIQAVLRRYRKTLEIDKAVHKWGDITLDEGKHEVGVKEEPILLAYKEYALLLALLQAKGDVVKRESLLLSIWGEYYDNSRTLDVHIRKLRKKLGDAGDFIQTVKHVGYKLKDYNYE